MGYRFHQSHRDANHGVFEQRITAIGCSFLDLSMVGGGAPDALVGDGGELDQLMEFKNPKTEKVGGKRQRATNEKQADFATTWRGRPVQRFNDPDEAVDWLLARRRERQQRTLRHLTLSSPISSE